MTMRRREAGASPYISPISGPGSNSGPGVSPTGRAGTPDRSLDDEEAGVAGHVSGSGGSSNSGSHAGVSGSHGRLRFNRNMMCCLLMLVVVVMLCCGVSLHRTVTLSRRLAEGAARAHEIHRHVDEIIPILIPVYSRPGYLKQVLEALSAVSNIDQTLIVVSQDGNFEEISELVDNIKFAPVVHLRHMQPYMNIPSHFFRTDYTTASNIKYLLTFAMEYLKSPAAIVLESDLVPSVDFYDYFMWTWRELVANETMRERVFTVNGYNMNSRKDADPFKMGVRDFTVWGWMCPGYMWPVINKGWTAFMNWDITMEESIRKPSGRVSLNPELSRVRNIGMQGINFDVKDAQAASVWTSVYMSDKPIVYEGVPLRVPSWTFESQ